jgi:hypothetical protein
MNLVSIYFSFLHSGGKICANQRAALELTLCEERNMLREVIFLSIEAAK